ncbi:hypothetical protein HYS72_03590 [Candidatus Pacearchaeota archaeon]|nr:hypothetical protein [Candidatus Pacearchaeota archaeon]
MIKKINIFGSVILFLLLINLSFVFAQENGEIVLGENTINFDSEKINYKLESEYGKEVTTLSFNEEGGFVEINGIRFENVLPSDISSHPSYLNLDKSGNIIEADLTANEKGSNFLINGLTFQAPPNSRVYYEEGGFFLEDVSITNIDKNQLAKISEVPPIYSTRTKFFDDLFVQAGGVDIQKEGYILSGGDFVYKNIEIKFLEGNEFFDVRNPEDKEGVLDIGIFNGDKLEITKKDYLLKGLPPKIKHESSKEGKTTIKNGRHTFEFENGKFISELGNLNTRNKLSIKSGIESNLIESKIINIDNDNGYSISELGKGNIFSFNKALLSPPNYNFESEIGKKIYSFAEEQIGTSAFVEEGRGQCYGEEALGVKGFDCIGLAITSLKKVYPDSSLKDFPPNLKLVDSLKEKGWNDFIIEPASVQNNVKTSEAVKKIPAGSIVFLMHNYQSYSPEEIGGLVDGIDYQNYLNSKQEKTFLVLGHTLIKGTGRKNFVNAYPGVRDSELPLRARKINENLIKQGKQPIFTGTVREGEMVPQDDYLIVISPPKD